MLYYSGLSNFGTVGLNIFANIPGHPFCSHSMQFYTTQLGRTFKFESRLFVLATTIIT